MAEHGRGVEPRHGAVPCREELADDAVRAELEAVGEPAVELDAEKPGCIRGGGVVERRQAVPHAPAPLLELADGAGKDEPEPAFEEDGPAASVTAAPAGKGVVCGNPVE